MARASLDASFRPVAVDRLPELNVPRAGHVLACPGGELTVIGGHTTGFVLTETAEYYKDGSWHLLQTLYPHDFGTWVTLPSGDILLAGGCEQSFGIGQSWGVECYDPSSHTFEPLPILDNRRTRFSSAVLADGTLLVSGNWYRKDAIAFWSPEKGGIQVKDVSQQRSIPYVLPVSSDNALIFGCDGSDGALQDSIIVDQLKGDAFLVPLLEQWQPIASECSEMARYFIGDERIDGYAWLIPARRKEDGQSGILKVVGEEFSLLETEISIPMTGMDGEQITWGGLLTDKTAEASWLVSYSESPTQRLYICKIEYGKALRGGKAPLTLYYAQMPEPGVFSSMTLMPGGRLAAVGGLESDNYHPLASAYILTPEASEKEQVFPFWWIAAGILLAVAAAVALWLRKRREAVAAERRDGQAAEDTVSDEAEMERRMDDLMARIAVLMEEGEAFRKKDLSKEYLSRVLGTNVRYLSDCINRKAGCSFVDYVNGYRIRYAQRLLCDNPGMRLSEISEESGFSSEVTFFRNFKARTGQTPSEWLASQNSTRDM
ncbi:MAG: helix-turn-helix domain-containing protein [Bacteroidales bacterium]|nr:helix-turn-helix domain-containing protein [Bacteroidales bacterium]